MPPCFPVYLLSTFRKCSLFIANAFMKRFVLVILVSILTFCQSCRYAKVVIWQPSHQTDTGKDFSEAATCNGIVEAAMAMEPQLEEYKVWSLGKEEYHHA